MNCCTLCFRLVDAILPPCYPLIYKRLLINQTDPKQRITVRQLLTHPWMMEGYETPVKWQTRSLALNMLACFCSVPSDLHDPGIALQCWTSRWWGRWQTTLEFQDKLRLVKFAPKSSCFGKGFKPQLIDVLGLLVIDQILYPG